MVKCVLPDEIADRNDISMDEKLVLAREFMSEENIQILLDAIKIKKLLDDVLKAANPEQAFIDLLRPLRKGMPTGEEGKISLGYRQDQIRNESHQILKEMMNDLRPGISDIWAKQDTSDLIKHLYGESTKNLKAKSHANAWNKAYDHMLKLYSGEGGHLRLERFSRIPISHDMNKILDADYQEWLTFVKERIAPGKINEEHIDEILKDMYNELVFGETPIKDNVRTVSKVRTNEDVFELRDSTAWNEYHDKFGNMDLYNSMQDQVTSMSHLIGAMEVFGSKPSDGYKLLKEAIIGSMPSNKRSDIDKAFRRADKIFHTSMGHLNSNNSWAMGGGVVGNIETGLKLGGAVIPAITDTVLMAVTSAFVGMPVFKALTTHLTTLVGKSKNDLAGQILLGFEHMMDVSHSTSRYSDIDGKRVSAKFAGGVLKWSGLQAWTISAKQAFGIEMTAHMTKAINNPGTRKTARILKMYGINDKDIAILQKAEKIVDRGVEYIDPMKLPVNVRRKWMGMMLSEQKMAVPEADAGVQALLTQGLEKGTPSGEIIRSVTQFKTFPMTIIANHWARAVGQTAGMERVAYIANMVAGTTMLGIVAIQAKQVLNGEEPQTLKLDGSAGDLDLIWKGFIQGGAGSFIADLFGAEIASRYGNGTLTDQLAGPFLGDMKAMFYILVTDIPKGTSHKDPLYPGMDATLIKLLERDMPNLWQTKLLLRRNFLDQLNKAADPMWQSKKISREIDMQINEGRGYWSRPGDPLQKSLGEL